MGLSCPLGSPHFVPTKAKLFGLTFWPYYDSFNCVNNGLGGSREGTPWVPYFYTKSEALMPEVPRYFGFQNYFLTNPPPPPIPPFSLLQGCESVTGQCNEN